jgi:hypothetical protein
MTKPKDLLSVRLSRDLAEALDRHCRDKGETRSRAVQQSLARYLVEQSGPTLWSLAEPLLPRASGRSREPRAPAAQRYRAYVRAKHRR